VLLQKSQDNRPKWWRYQRVCCFYGSRDEIDACHLDCAAGTHRHPTRAEAEEYVRTGAAEWIVVPVNRRDRGVIRILKKAAAYRGLSCRVGAALAVAARQNWPWAKTMLQDIRRHQRS
jgi:hypothetical protein